MDCLLSYGRPQTCLLYTSVLGIDLGIIGYLLAFRKGLEAFALNSGEMNENVLAALIVGDEAIALSLIHI